MAYKVHPDITIAETLPGRFYKDQAVYDLCKQKIFLKAWHWLGNLKELDGLTLSTHAYPTSILDGFLDEPVVVVRDGQDSLRCLSNVCTHRGNIVVQQPGKFRNLSCLYHGRKFNLDGSFNSMPEFQGTKDFPRPCDDLRNFPLANWNGFLFANLDNDARFDEIQSVLDHRVGFLPFDMFTAEPTMDREYFVKANWALYCDNYLEGFHVPFVHPDLNQQLDYSSYTTELLGNVVLQIGYSNQSDSGFDLPDRHPDFGKNVAAYYYWIFPNLMLNFYPWGLSVNVVKPVSINKTKVQFISYVFDESKLDFGAGAMLDKVEREDEFVVESVQRGVQSNFYTTGRYSPGKETGVHHFHQLITQYLNS